MARRKRHVAARKRPSEVKKEIVWLFVRYVALLLVALPNLWIFYKIFTPLTAYPVSFLLGISYDVSLLGTSIILVSRSIPIELINACIAGSAYYLLTILNLSTPDIKLKKRITVLLTSFAAFLVVNILRIYVLSRMAVSGSSFFDITHLFFWYSISTVLIVLIWFVEVKVFKVKGIPFYSDIKFLYKNTK